MKICFDRYGRARVQKNNSWEFNNGYHGSAFISKKWDGYNIEDGKVQVLNVISNQIFTLDTMMKRLWTLSIKNLNLN